MSSLSQSEQSTLINGVARRLSWGWTSCRLRLRPSEASNASMILTSGKLSPAVYRRLVISVAIDESSQIHKTASKNSPFDSDPWSSFIKSTVTTSESKNSSAVQESIDVYTSLLQNTRIPLRNPNHCPSSVPLEISMFGYTASQNNSNDDSIYVPLVTPSHHQYRTGLSTTVGFESELFPEEQQNSQVKIKPRANPKLVRKTSERNKPKPHDVFVLGRKLSNNRSALLGGVKPVLASKPHPSLLSPRKNITKTYIRNTNTNSAQPSSLNATPSPNEANQTPVVTTNQPVIDNDQEDDEIQLVSTQVQSSTLKEPRNQESVEMEIIETQGPDQHEDDHEDTSEAQKRTVTNIGRGKTTIVRNSDAESEYIDGLTKEMREKQKAKEAAHDVASFVEKVKTMKNIQKTKTSIQKNKTSGIMRSFEDDELPELDDTAFTRLQRSKELKMQRESRQREKDRRKQDLEARRQERRIAKIMKKREKAQKRRGIHFDGNDNDGDSPIEDPADSASADEDAQEIINISDEDADLANQPGARSARERPFLAQHEQESKRRRVGNHESNWNNGVQSNYHDPAPAHHLSPNINNRIPHNQNHGFNRPHQPGSPHGMNHMPRYPPGYSIPQAAPFVPKTYHQPYPSAATHPFQGFNPPQHPFSSSVVRQEGQNHQPEQYGQYPPNAPIPQKPYFEPPEHSPHHHQEPSTPPPINIVESIEKTVGGVSDYLKRLALDFEKGDRSMFRPDENETEIPIGHSQGNVILLRLGRDSGWTIVKRRS